MTALNVAALHPNMEMVQLLIDRGAEIWSMPVGGDRRRYMCDISLEIESKILACPPGEFVVELTLGTHTGGIGDSIKCFGGTSIGFTPTLSTESVIVASSPTGIHRFFLATDENTLISTTRTQEVLVASKASMKQEGSAPLGTVADQLQMKLATDHCLDAMFAYSVWNGAPEYKDSIVEVGHPLGPEKGIQCPINAVRIWRGPATFLVQFRYSCYRNIN